MKKGFLIYGSIVCMAYAYATLTGWSIPDAMSSGKWSPHGQTVHHK